MYEIIKDGDEVHIHVIDHDDLERGRVEALQIVRQRMKLAAGQGHPADSSYTRNVRLYPSDSEPVIERCVVYNIYRSSGYGMIMPQATTLMVNTGPQADA